MLQYVESDLHIPSPFARMQTVAHEKEEEHLPRNLLLFLQEQIIKDSESFQNPESATKPSS